MKPTHPKIDIGKLREIGWSLWDPIGLSDRKDSWKGQAFEDEYDTYLIKAAGMLRNRCSRGEVVDYLFWVETNVMGLCVGNGEAKLREGLLQLVTAISNDPEVWSDSFTI